MSRLRVGHLLNRQVEVWRPATVPDGAGGQTTTWTQAGTVRAKVDQPTARERLLAAQSGSEHSHTVYCLPSAGVLRGDELRGDGQVLRVLAVVQPSAAIYSKAECELTQAEGEPDHG